MKGSLRALKQQALSLCLLLLALCPSVSAAEGEKAGSDDAKAAALQINTDNIGDLIERQTAPALVAFIVEDTCDACQQLLPVMDKVATNLKGIANVGVINCNRVEAVRTCRAYNTQGFPKLLLFKPGTKVNPYTGGSMKDFGDFTGPVSAKALISAVTDTLDTSHLAPLSTSAEATSFLQQEPKLAKVLLFSDKPSSTVLAKGLSWAYARRLLFAEVRPSEAEGKALADKYGVDKYPTILLLKTDGSSEVYTGALKAPELRSFLDSHAPDEPLPPPQGAGKAGRGLHDPLGQLAQVEVASLEAGNLTEINAHDDMWLIGFYATAGGDTCVSQLEELRKLLVEVQGIVKYGTLDVTGVNASLLQPYELDTAALSAKPCWIQLVLLPYGDFKQAKGAYRRWSGGLGDAKGLQEWILQTVPDYTVPLSSEVEAQAFLEASVADLPKAPKAHTYEERHAPIGKVLLFTNKGSVPGVYRALALQFVGTSRLLFAWVQVSETEGPGIPLMQKMNVRRAPAMTILFPLPKKPLGADNDEVPNEPRDNMAIQQYMGPLKFQKMFAWLTAMSTLTGMSYKSHAGATPGTPPEHFEIINQAQLQAACYDKPGLCLITLLDGRSDTANQHRDTVKKSAATHAGQPVNWVVVDVSRQPSFRRAYGFTADQLPALIALSTKRMRFAQGAAPFSDGSAKQLVQKVLMGTAITLPLPDLPRLVDDGEPEEEVGDAQEEFRLDEVMAEEVKELFRKEEKLKQADEEIRQEALQKQQKKAKSSSKKKKKKKKGKKASSSSSKAKAESVRDEL